MTHPDLAGLRVLVVEDNPLQRRILIKILETLRAQEVRQAADGTEALTILTSFLPDIILTNWQMRPMAGLELARRVRASERQPFQTVPIIMLSANDDHAQAGRARDAGINAFMTKPVSPLQLGAKVIEVIANPRPFIRSATYIGPDRRFRDVPFSGSDRRRADT
jgi:two-component system, chemotaxis family, chemotaxis protein CheY